jgi:hypothetical protein
MRNVFDQYEQPENRLTHALLCSLDADRHLLQAFVRWVTGREKSAARLSVDEQSFPGEAAAGADDGERRGVPDACIADGSGWALLIESKLGRRWDVDQLRRHRASALRHALTEVTILCLTAGPSAQAVPAGCVAKTWSHVYAWLSRHRPGSEWARRCMQYFEVVESRLMESKSWTGSAITTFTGIPFGHGDAYNYQQAKRVLALLRATLLEDEALVRFLDVDRSHPGRAAITGSKGRRVWDFIALRGARKPESFTSFPHLTLGLHDERLEAMLTIPNGVPAALRRALLGASFVEFEQRVNKVMGGLQSAVKTAAGARPVVNVVQRHYPSQRAEPIYDAVLRFDLTTALPGSGKRAVKHQPQWLELAFEVLHRRGSNLQFQIGVEFPYERCGLVHRPEIAGAIALVWRACKPLLDEARSP